MALFQPTFILPDQRSGLGQGTVDVTEGLTVSWHISGQNAMTGFEIVISSAAGVQLYTTGRRADGCPAYGTAPDGEMLFFSYTVPASALSGAGVVNGNEYRFAVTQYWNGGSVVQSSPSVFLTRSAPTLSIVNPGTVTTRFYTFTGAYAQAQGDVLNWFRWRLALADNENSPLYDSGNVSGTMNLSMTYDGLFPGQTYALRLTAQTENGVEADTGWVEVSVDYDAPIGSGVVNASCAVGTDAVFVSWPGVTYIPGTPVGTYEISGGALNLASADSRVLWNSVNGGPMSFAPPWSVIYRGTITGKSVALFWIFDESNANYPALLSWENGVLSFSYNDRQSGVMRGVDHPGVPVGSVVTVVVTAKMLYLRIERYTGGLYPAETLYPGAALYPKEDDVLTVETAQYAVDILQAYPIDLVYMYGSQVCDYLEILQGTVSAQVVSDAMAGTYQPGTGGESYFLADFNSSLNAGNLDIGNDTLVGYALYRRQGSAGVLEHIADVGPETTALYDYGAKSAQGPYAYYLFPVGRTTYISQSLESNAVVPCWWDWDLLQCAPTEDSGQYTVTAEYRFRYNLSTGAMSNNNTPNLLENFTAYPTVQLSPQNYKSGSLTGLIGWVSQGTYTDTLSLRDALFALSVTDDALFLKSRKGDLLRVRIREAVTAQTGDATREQTQTVTLNWAEVGPATGLGLYALESAAQNSPSSGGGSGGGTAGRGQVKVVSPGMAEQVITPDAGYDYLSQVVVRGVAFSSVQNESGYTAVIGTGG